MKIKTGLATVFLVAMLGTVSVMAQELYVYPAKGQSAELQDKDKYECYQWAKRDTGFDPMAAPTTSSPATSSERRQGGIARGALGGAAIGAIAGDSDDARKGAVSVACWVVYASGGRMSVPNRKRRSGSSSGQSNMPVIAATIIVPILPASKGVAIQSSKTD